MRVISRKALREFWKSHPASQRPLEDWYRIVKHVEWPNLARTRRDFLHADLVGDCTVFNIGGNKYRLIAKIRYNKQRVYIVHILTHSDYDKEKWKDDCIG